MNSLVDAVESGFFVKNGQIGYRGLGREVVYQEPVALLLDRTSGFLNSGSVAAMQSRRNALIAACPDMAADLAIVPVRATSESVAQANDALHNNTKALAIAKSWAGAAGADNLATASIH